MATKSYGEIVGPTDETWLIGSTIGGVPGGFRAIGRGHIRYTSQQTGAVSVEVDATNGWTAQTDMFPAGTNVETSFPIYGFTEWPNNEDHQVRLNIALGENCTVHEAQFEIGVEVRPALIA